MKTLRFCQCIKGRRLALYTVYQPGVWVGTICKRPKRFVYLPTERAALTAPELREIAAFMDKAKKKARKS